MNEFEIGDVVQLKSGGPKMTVKFSPPEKGEVLCQWFGGSKLESGYFPKASLIKIDEGEKKEKNRVIV